MDKDCKDLRADAQMTRTERTIHLLRQGWLTAFQSASLGGVQALSQRCGGEIANAGWVVESKMVESPGGARVKAYRIVGRVGIAEIIAEPLAHEIV